MPDMKKPKKVFSVVANSMLISALVTLPVFFIALLVAYFSGPLKPPLELAAFYLFVVSVIGIGVSFYRLNAPSD